MSRSALAGGSTSSTREGNFVQVVQYDEVQFTKTESVLRGMGLELGKTDTALAELRAKHLA